LQHGNSLLGWIGLLICYVLIPSWNAGNRGSVFGGTESRGT